MRIIKRILCAFLIFFLLFILCAVLTLSIRFHRKSQLRAADKVTLSGTEYTYLASEPSLYYLGELEFETGIESEPERLAHQLDHIQTGLYSIKEAKPDNILIRYLPDNEWYSIYRKSSLPPLDYSVDNCSRLEFVDSKSYLTRDTVHTPGDECISEPSEIAEFLSDIRSQKTPAEAGLYDLVIQPNGFYKNCYETGAIYGYFEAEPYVYIRMDVTSFNDQAYSVQIDGKDYVLPDQWAERLDIH